MRFSATLIDPRDPDGAPLFESTDHPDADSAVRAATTHVWLTHPGDRVFDQGGGIYEIWSAGNASQHVATLLVAHTDADGQ